MQVLRKARKQFMTRMMKSITALILCVMLLGIAPVCAEMDNTLLTNAPGAQVWHLNDIDLVIRTVSMPFMASCDNGAW